MDGIAALAWAPDSKRLAVASWDSVGRPCSIANRSTRTSTTFPTQWLLEGGYILSSAADDRLEHPAAVLSVAFGSSRDTLYTGCLDRRVRECVRLHLSCLADNRWNLSTGEARVLGAHENGVSAMAWIPEQNVLITGSWDKSVKVWCPYVPL